MERLHIPCAANLLKDCSNPREDEHHLYPRRTAETRLQKTFGNLACNKVVSCRCIHERVLDHLPPPEYPTPQDMKAKIATETGRRYE